MIEAMIVTNPVTASDLKMSLELLFHVIDAKIAIWYLLIVIQG